MDCKNRDQSPSSSSSSDPESEKGGAVGRKKQLRKKLTPEQHEKWKEAAMKTVKWWKEEIAKLDEAKKDKPKFKPGEILLGPSAKPGPSIEPLLQDVKKKEERNKDRVLSSTLDPGPLPESYIDFDCSDPQKAVLKRLADLAKTIDVPDVEDIPVRQMSDRQQKRLRKAERLTTKGKDWFDMPAPEITEDKKKHLELLKMRSIWDKKRHYKDVWKGKEPKYFQIGTVIEGATMSRLGEKRRKKESVDGMIEEIAKNL